MQQTKKTQSQQTSKRDRKETKKALRKQIRQESKGKEVYKRVNKHVIEQTNKKGVLKGQFWVWIWYRRHMCHQAKFLVKKRVWTMLDDTNKHIKTHAWTCKQGCKDANKSKKAHMRCHKASIKEAKHGITQMGELTCFKAHTRLTRETLTYKAKKRRERQAANKPTSWRYTLTHCYIQTSHKRREDVTK